MRPARCGEDFCVYCGDCLACYGGEQCAIEDTEVHPTMVSEDGDEGDDDDGVDEGE